MNNTNKKKLNALQVGNHFVRSNVKHLTGKSDNSAKDNETSLLSKNFSMVRKFQGLENKTKISHISEKTDFNIRDDFDVNRTNSIIDKIIIANGLKKNEVTNKSSKIVLENSKNEIDLLSQFEKLSNSMNKLTLTSPKEANEKFELVEKHIIDDLKGKNEKLSKQIQERTDHITETKAKYVKVTGEFSFVKQVNESQTKEKTDNSNKRKILLNRIKEAEKLSGSLKVVLAEETVQKDNLYRAVINYTKRYDEKMANELAELYQSFNNQYFLATYRPPEEDEIEKLMGRISLYENEITRKTKEIKELNKFVIIPDKKQSTTAGTRRNSNTKK
jgi:hypothetical protein